MVRLGRPVNETVDKIRTLLAQGLNQSQVAKALGITHQAVSIALKRAEMLTPEQAKKRRAELLRQKRRQEKLEGR